MARKGHLNRGEESDGARSYEESSGASTTLSCDVQDVTIHLFSVDKPHFSD